MAIIPLKFPEVLVFDTTVSIASRLPEFVKDNHAYGIGNVVRGMHFQQPNPQAKLVECECGQTWNAVVDVRFGSSTFGQWDAVILAEEDNKKLFIPAGFAHGFYTLSEENYLIIKLSAPYDNAGSQTFSWDDAEVAIDWPFLDKTVEPILSPDDRDKPLLSEIAIATLPKYR